MSPSKDPTKVPANYFKEPLATLAFESELVMEYSALPKAQSLGTHKNLMSLYLEDEEFNNCIIWNFGKQAADEDDEVIGLEIEGHKVVGYDGLMSLPMQAVMLLKAAGFDTSEVEDNE